MRVVKVLLFILGIALLAFLIWLCVNIAEWMALL